MSNGEAHVLRRNFVLPGMEVSGDQAADRQTGQTGKKEVDAKGFVDVLVASNCCWEKMREK